MTWETMNKTEALLVSEIMDRLNAILAAYNIHHDIDESGIAEYRYGNLAIPTNQPFLETMRWFIAQGLNTDDAYAACEYLIGHANLNERYQRCI